MVSATLTLLTADVTGGDPQATGGGQDFVDGAGGESFVSDMQDALVFLSPNPHNILTQCYNRIKSKDKIHCQWEI